MCATYLPPEVPWYVAVPERLPAPTVHLELPQSF
jgi:hypothetical protein